MPSLFGRNRQTRELTRQLTMPEQPMSGVWARQLEGIGRAIDAYDAPLRDIAISVTGDRTLVTALAWCTGSFHSGWHPVTFAIVAGMPRPMA